MIKIGGLQKLTLIDYPGKIAATVFLIGCDFRCPWCYNPELVLPEEIKKVHPPKFSPKIWEGKPRISEKDFFEFLKKRNGLLEAVTICGGEPCLNKDLPKFVKKIKKIGYVVKIDTNGSFPEMLRYLIDKKLINYVALDIKAPKEKYEKVTGGRVNVKYIERSVSFLKENKIDYEFRTTVVPFLLEKEDILKIAKWISGAKKYYLQNFRPEKTLDPKFEKIKPYPQEYLLEIQKAISPFFDICQLR